MKYVSRLIVPAVLLATLTVVTGCKKKTTTPPPTETAPVTSGPAPTAQLTATPNAISAGDQVVLSWRTTDADSITIDGIGTVPSTGVKNVQPTVSTSYHLMARGPGGVADSTARVTVTAPPAVSVPTSEMSEDQSFKSNVQDIFYDYDSAEIRTDAQAMLAKNAAYLNSHPNVRFIIGGYADERGSNEYNLALGQNRAEAARDALVNAGVSASRIRVISFGKEKPFCTESTEDCWQQNRRGGFALDR